MINLFFEIEIAIEIAIGFYSQVCFDFGPDFDLDFDYHAQIPKFLSHSNRLRLPNPFRKSPTY